MRWPGGSARFEIDPEIKHRLLNGLDDIALTLEQEDAIAAYEHDRERSGSGHERAVSRVGRGGAAQAFSAHAADYTALRRRLVPGYDAFYGTVVDVLGLVDGGVHRVLDLGAGTGLLSAARPDGLPRGRGSSCSTGPSRCSAKPASASATA